MGILKAEKNIKAPRNALPGSPSTLVPILRKVYEASGRLERQIEALRLLEALRLHAAAHGGELPDSLAAITEVPVPLDPIASKAFDYQRQGNTATLSGPEGFLYEITMTPTK